MTWGLSTIFRKDMWPPPTFMSLKTIFSRLNVQVILSIVCVSMLFKDRCRYGNLERREKSFLLLKSNFYGLDFWTLQDFSAELFKRNFPFKQHRKLFILLHGWWAVLYWFSFLPCLHHPLHHPHSLSLCSSSFHYVFCVEDEKQHQNSPFQLNKEVPCLVAICHKCKIYDCQGGNGEKKFFYIQPMSSSNGTMRNGILLNIHPVFCENIQKVSQWDIFFRIFNYFLLRQP